MGVKEVAAASREVYDVGFRHRPAVCHERLANLELLEVLAKWVDPAGRLRGAGHVLVDHARQSRRRALEGSALHVVQHAPHAAHLFAAPGAPRAAVHEMRERGTVSGRLFRALPVDEQKPSVMRRCAQHDLLRHGVVGREEGANERSLSHLRELDRLVHASIGHHGVHGAEGFDVVRRALMQRVFRIEQERRKERPSFGIRADDIEVVGIAIHAFRYTRDRLDAPANLTHL